MAQASFVLKEPKSIEVTLVYLLFTFNSNRLKYSTGQKINPKFWNSGRYRAKEVREFGEAKTFNLLLDKLESDVQDAYRILLLEGITPTPEHLRARLNETLKKGDGNAKDLAQFGKAIVDASNRKPGTKRAIGQTIRILTEFKAKTCKSLHFDAIDLDFYDAFLDYTVKQGYSHNTIGTHVKNIKVFMREAFERGLTKNLQFRSKRFKKLDEESQNIYLTTAELSKLYDLDLKDNPRLDRVRDLFLVGCYTGLRFSDLTGLQVENFNRERRVMKVRTQKTGETVVIPINSKVAAIIEKWDGKLPTAISNEKLNAYLKELGEEAKFSEAVEIVSTKGGKRVREVFKKWELITVHTARRSFASNAYLHQVPTISIMKITGHRTEKSFLKYIKISQEDNANKLIDHPFFL